ncbi:MAG: hypothetical protein HOA17_04885 [Candidatus Melainabacteria bacterium]|jgi:hypothetical protein|nr:hypothetical protein [Candidatus Melainabacteria bacterium]
MVATATSIKPFEMEPILWNKDLSLSYQQPSEESGLWSKARNLAEIVCSRESIFRSALDLTGWEIPVILANAMRNKYSFAEAVFQGTYAFLTMVMAPYFTKWVGHLAGKSIMKEDEHKDIDKYMLFQLNDLDDQQTLNTGLERIKEEEPEDSLFLSQLYSKNQTKSDYYQNQAEVQKSFFNNLTVDDSKLQRIKKLKRATIQGESFIEGGLWGGLFMASRLFRKYVLKQDRFTGTKAYESDEESKKGTDSSKMAWWQWAGVLGSMISSPILNHFVLNKVEDKEAVAKSPWLKTIKNQWDMTHGVFPKLGLMVSFLMMPVNAGWLFSAQGKNELIEALMMIATMVPSWWFGHRITNGVLAQNADKKLSEKFGVERGILVEPGDLHQATPEPAKIQHVLRKVRHDPKLEKEARDEHAKVLYKGFALHSSMIFGIKLLINQITKWRVAK